MSELVTAVAWLPNGHDGVWAAVRGRVAETPTAWDVSEVEVLAACYAPESFEWLVAHGDPAAQEEVSARLQRDLSERDADEWRLRDALVDAYRTAHGEPEPSEAEVLRRMYGEVKRLRDALMESMRMLKASYVGWAAWEQYRDHSPEMKRWAELLGGMPEGL